MLDCVPQILSGNRLLVVPLAGHAWKGSTRLLEVLLEGEAEAGKGSTRLLEVPSEGAVHGNISGLFNVH